MESREALSDAHFKPLAGKRLVFDPCAELKERSQKHPCPDCHFCQFCSEARCHTCHGESSTDVQAGKRKLSLREQIRLFDEINRK